MLFFNTPEYQGVGFSERRLGHIMGMITEWRGRHTGHDGLQIAQWRPTQGSRPTSSGTWFFLRNVSAEDALIWRACLPSSVGSN